MKYKEQWYVHATIKTATKREIMVRVRLADFEKLTKYCKLVGAKILTTRNEDYGYHEFTEDEENKMMVEQL